MLSPIRKRTFYGNPACLAARLARSVTQTASVYMCRVLCMWKDVGKGIDSAVEAVVSVNPSVCGVGEIQRVLSNVRMMDDYV